MNKTSAFLIAAIFISSTVTGLIGCKSAEAHQDHSTHQHGSAAKPYPLQTCIVSDEKLDDHGKPIVFVHQGQDIKICCVDCRESFDKNPQQYLQKLSAHK